MHSNIARLGNTLFDTAPWLYNPLYSFYKRISDRSERNWIARRVRSGSTIIDVGANIGAYTAYFAGLTGPAGSVIALEPDPENFRRLSRATAGLTWVELHSLAASNTTGECILYRSSSLNVDHQTYDSGEHRERLSIPCVRLDDLVPSGRKVDFIKIDIQGAEGFALSGAQRILSENRDIALLFEYWPYAIHRSGFDPVDVLNNLRNLGFHLRVLGNGIGDRQGKEDYCNYVALRDNALL